MEKEHDRKPVRLKRFDYSQNRVYFITICTLDKKCILSDIVPPIQAEPLSRDGFMPKVELTEIGKIVEKYILSINNAKSVAVSKYVIMPNHIHLLLTVNNYIGGPDITHGISQNNSANKRANDTIPHVISTFKRFCNREIGENIFQRSYYDHIIRNNEDYDETVKYIYYNPRRWYLKYRIPKR